jgi:hypothetical protein
MKRPSKQSPVLQILGLIFFHIYHLYYGFCIKCTWPHTQLTILAGKEGTKKSMVKNPRDTRGHCP